MSSIQNNIGVYEIRNYEGWSLRSEVEKGEFSVELKDKWGLPYKKKITFIWDEASKQSTLHETIKSLSITNNRSRFHVYEQKNFVHVVFGQGGLVGGMRRNDEIPFELQAKAVIMVGAPLIVMGMGTLCEHQAGKGIVSQTLLDSVMYVCKTPKKEYSHKALAQTALRGAGVGLMKELVSAFGKVLLSQPNMSPMKKICLQGGISAVGYIGEKILRLEEPSYWNTFTAAFSGGVSSAISHAIDLGFSEINAQNLKESSLPNYVSTETLRRIEVATTGAVKGGVSSTIGTLIWNLFSFGEADEQREWHEDLLTAFLSGSVIGGIDGLKSGETFEELKVKKEKILNAEQKLADLEKDSEKKSEILKKAKSHSDEMWEKKDRLKKEWELKKEQAIQAHNEFIATGNGENAWKAKQKEVNTAHTLYVQCDIWSAYSSQSEAERALYPLYDLIQEQKSLIKSLRKEVMSVLSNLVTGIHSSIDSVDPLNTQLQRTVNMPYRSDWSNEKRKRQLDRVKELNGRIKEIND